MRSSTPPGRREPACGLLSEALSCRCQCPNIDLAVMMRDLSAHRQERQQASESLQGLCRRSKGILGKSSTLEGALIAAFLICYAQGMALLQRGLGNIRL